MNQTSARDAIESGGLDSQLSGLYPLPPEGVTGLHERFLRLMNRHESIFGDASCALFSAPGRTELSGNHTDHNNGRVLASAVHLDAVAVASLSPIAGRGRIRIHSEGYDEPFDVAIDLKGPRACEAGTTSALVRGVAVGLIGMGFLSEDFPSVDAVVASALSPGSGLSSSAAIETLIGTMLSVLGGTGEVDPISLAIIGQRAENEYFGKPCGLMDQLACASGGVIGIDFESPGHPRVTRLAVDFQGYGYALYVVNTGGSHADLTADYAAVTTEMKAVAAALGRPTLRGATGEALLSPAARLRDRVGDRAILRAMHYFDENRRVEEQVAALSANDIPRFLGLVRESGSSSWRLLQNVVAPGNPRNQALALALALSESYLGTEGAARVHGGGFAGTIQAFVPLTRAVGFEKHLSGVFGDGSVTRLYPREVGPVQLHL